MIYLQITNFAARTSQNGVRTRCAYVFEPLLFFVLSRHFRCRWRHVLHRIFQAWRWYLRQFNDTLLILCAYFFCSHEFRFTFNFRRFGYLTQGDFFHSIPSLLIFLCVYTAFLVRVVISPNIRHIFGWIQMKENDEILWI